MALDVIPGNVEFRRATRLAFDKKIKTELQIGKDFLKDVFMKKSLVEKHAACDFVNRLGMKTFTPTRSNTSSDRRGATPTGQTPSWRRRVTRPKYADARVDINRYDAKELGMSVGRLGEIYGERLADAVKAQQTAFILDFLDDPAIENIRLDDFPSTSSPAETGQSQIEFLPSQNFFPPLVGTGATARIPLTVKSLLAIAAHFHDEMFTDFNLDNRVENSISNVKAVLIMNNRAWVDFINQNLEELGNRDFFGKPLYLTDMVKSDRFSICL